MAYENAKLVSDSLYKCYDMYHEMDNSGMDIYRSRIMNPRMWLKHPRMLWKYYRLLDETRLACQKVLRNHVPTSAEPFEMVKTSNPKDVKTLGGTFMLLGEDVPNVHNNYSYDIRAQIFPTSADMHDVETFHKFVVDKGGLCAYLGCNWSNWREEIKQTGMYKIAHAAHPGVPAYFADREHAYYLDEN